MGLNPENPNRNNRPEHGRPPLIDHPVVPVGHDSLLEIAPPHRQRLKVQTLGSAETPCGISTMPDLPLVQPGRELPLAEAANPS